MVVLVTGSSKGIGRATILKYAREGYDVVINYNNSKEEALLLEEEVKKLGVKALSIKADVSNEEEVINMTNIIKNEFGSIDVLVNNAGIAIDTTFEDKTVDNFRRILEVNLIGTFLVSKYASKIMNKGVIINVSSTNGLDTVYPESLDYDASKAGVISLTHNLAKQFAPNIRVNAICPGWVKTEMNKELDNEFISKELDKIKLNRFATASEIADAIYNISICTYINDAIIRVDGGENA
ncbi:MAG: SDR family oxidoreductase [Bacilli bacterium]|nr:SDR family oxidoreductase [Bacilli bacterium]